MAILKWRHCGYFRSTRCRSVTCVLCQNFVFIHVFTRTLRRIPLLNPRVVARTILSFIPNIGGSFKFLYGNISLVPSLVLSVICYVSSVILLLLLRITVCKLMTIVICHPLKVCLHIYAIRLKKRTKRWLYLRDPTSRPCKDRGRNTKALAG